MLLARDILNLEEVVRQLGYRSLQEFALAKARQDILKEISESSKRIEEFEKKYGMDYADFCKRFHQIAQPLFEKEEDSSDWNAELKFLSLLQKRLAKLA